MAKDRKVRAHVYLTPDTLAGLSEIAESHPGISNRNAAIEYLVALHRSIKAERESRGLKGPVPLESSVGPI